MELRVCTQCGVEKPLSDYYCRVRIKNGKEYTSYGQCKECVKSRRAKYREQFPDKVKECKYLSRQRNIEKYQERDAAYYQANQERRKQWQTQYRHNNEVTVKEGKKIYYRSNADEIKQKASEYRDNHREQIRENAIKYRNTPRGRAVLIVARRKRKAALKETTDPNLVSKISLIKESKNVQCYWCGKYINGTDGNECHIDHVIPLSKGGSHSADNVVPSCVKCNLRKGSKMPNEFKKELYAIS